MKDGKQAILSLFMSYNQKYAVEVKKDGEKEAKFIYSKFSPYDDCIDKKRKVYLKEVLSLV